MNKYIAPSAIKIISLCESIDRCIDIVEERARLQKYVKRIVAAVNYKGTADHEDVPNILQEFETENLDLLNRNECEKQLLEAEIERLKDYNENLLTANTALSNEILDIKSEAIKEFFMKLEALCGITDSDIVVAIDVAELKDLYKEMVGEGE